MLPGWANQPTIESLDDEPLHHVVMGAWKDIILQAFLCLGNGLIRELLKPRDLVLEGIGFAQRKKLGEKCIRALLPGWHCLRIGIEPLFRLSLQWKWKEAKMYHILSHSSHSECTTDLQEVLKMSISIFRCLAVEWALLHHVDKS
jgi:hypothetical protein